MEGGAVKGDKDERDEEGEGGNHADKKDSDEFEVVEEAPVRIMVYQQCFWTSGMLGQSV